MSRQGQIEPSNSDFQHRLAVLQFEFVQRSTIEAGDLAKIVDRLDEPGADDMVERVRVIAHRLAGAAGVFGYNDLCAAAVELEDLARDKPPSSEALRRALFGLLSELDKVARTQP